MDPPKPDNYNSLISESNFIIFYFILSGIYLLPLFPLISINKQISTVKILLSFMFISTLTQLILYFQQHYFVSFNLNGIFSTYLLTVAWQTLIFSLGLYFIKN